LDTEKTSEDTGTCLVFVSSAIPPTDTIAHFQRFLKGQDLEPDVLPKSRFWKKSGIWKSAIDGMDK
jgi:hypothetical protein